MVHAQGLHAARPRRQRLSYQASRTAAGWRCLALDVSAGGVGQRSRPVLAGFAACCGCVRGGPSNRVGGSGWLTGVPEDCRGASNCAREQRQRASSTRHEMGPQRSVSRRPAKLGRALARPLCITAGASKGNVQTAIKWGSVKNNPEQGPAAIAGLQLSAAPPPWVPRRRWPPRRCWAAAETMRARGAVGCRGVVMQKNGDATAMHACHGKLRCRLGGTLRGAGGW